MQYMYAKIQSVMKIQDSKDIEKEDLPVLPRLEEVEQKVKPGQIITVSTRIRIQTIFQQIQIVLIGQQTKTTDQEASTDLFCYRM